MSEFIEQVVDVARETNKSMATWFQKHPNETMNVEVQRSIVTNSFKIVAKKAGINESTVRDKCTRQLGVNTDRFFYLISQYGATNGNSQLEEIIVAKRKKEDSPEYVLKMIRQIKASSTWHFIR